MTTQVPVKLTDQEWRTKAEELAKLELRRKTKRGQLAEEQDEWKERRKDLEAQMDSMTEQIEILAREVDTREAMVDPQQELPLQTDASSQKSDSEEQTDAPEPGSDG